MNLSDDLTPIADPAPLLRAVRRRRRFRTAIRAGLSSAAVLAVTIAFWPRQAPHQTPVASPAPPPSASAAMTRAEFLDSLKDETFAFIQWPDGREQLLIRR